MDTKHLQLKLELSFKIDLIDDYRSMNTNFNRSCFYQKLAKDGVKS
jgi:hypothetical protein